MEKFRICKSTSLKELVDLGNKIITPRFTLKGDITTLSTRIRLVMCDQCRLVKLKDITATRFIRIYTNPVP